MTSIGLSKNQFCQIELHLQSLYKLQWHNCKVFANTCIEIKHFITKLSPNKLTSGEGSDHSPHRVTDYLLCLSCIFLLIVVDRAHSCVIVTKKLHSIPYNTVNHWNSVFNPSINQLTVRSGPSNRAASGLLCSSFQNPHSTIPWISGRLKYRRNVSSYAPALSFTSVFSISISVIHMGRPAEATVSRRSYSRQYEDATYSKTL